MTWSQILAVLLAAIAAGGFFQTATLLGPAATGWQGGPFWIRLGLYGLALFWLAAAVYALSHPAIVRLGTLILAALFAKAALLVMVLSLRRRVPPTR